MLKKETIKNIESQLDKDIDKEVELIKSEIFYFLDKDLDMFFFKRVCQTLSKETSPRKV
ncbi:hypothetical protein [Thermodesulfobacterium commune]|uniref:hypothetical protein n=1 Tax=Thermodesulfobacterium commune TaxID=1741 RepID=UPI002FD97F5A